MAQNITKPVGATGLKLTWGGVDDDFLNEWRGQQKVKRVREMLSNSPVIGAAQMAIEGQLLDIDFTATSDESDDDPRLELIEESLAGLRTPLTSHIVEAVLSVFYGWHVFAINYKRVNGRVLWDDFVPLGHDTIESWLTDDRGYVSGVKQYSWVYPDPIPYDRLIHYRFRPNRNSPEGRSALRPSWIPYYFTKNIQHLEGIAIERNLNGLPVLEPAMGADMSEGSTDYVSSHKLLRNVRVDEQHGVILPPPNGEGEHNRWHFTLATGGGAGKVADTDTVIARYEKRMLMSFLSQFLILGMDGVGTQAAFAGGSDFYTMAVNALADNIADTFHKQAITPLLKLNGYDAEGITFSHSPAGNIDLTAVNNIIKGASGLLTWSEQDEEWLRQLVRMPKRVEDEIEEPITKKPVEDMPDDMPEDDMMTVTRYQVETGNKPLDEKLKEYEAQLEELSQRAIDGKIERPDFERQMADITTAAILLAFLLAGGNPQDPKAQRELQQEQQKAAESIPSLASDIYNGRYGKIPPMDGKPGQSMETGKAKLLDRLELWVFSMAGAYSLGQLFKPVINAALLKNYRWNLGRTVRHCPICLNLNGQVHTAAEWKASGYVPQRVHYRCDCYFTEVSEPSQGMVF